MGMLRKVLMPVLVVAGTSCLNLDSPPEENVVLSIGVSNQTPTVGEQIDITITATNDAKEGVTLKGASDCLLFFQVRDSRNGVLMYASTDACTGSTTSESLPAGGHRSGTLQWDGRTGAGSFVPPGFYIIVPGASLSTGAILGLPITVQLVD